LPSLTDQITAYAQEKRLSPHTLARWQTWIAEDQAALLTLARELQLNDNHLRDFLDWLEEIALRDRCTVSAVLAGPEIQRHLCAKTARTEKLKAVKESLRRVRYPRLSRLEEDLRAAIKALDLGGRVRVSFPPTLEGDEVTVTITARNAKELDDCLTRLRRRLEEGGFQQLFDLLDEG
jgi:hypothetical protein